MEFVHRITGEVVTIKSGDADHVWFKKEGVDTLFLQEVHIFFTEYMSIADKEKEKQCNKK